MKAQTILASGEPSSVTERDVPQPAPGKGQVLVRVHAAALNPADLKVLRGKDGGGFLHARRFPLVLGFDFAGVVEALGDVGAGQAQVGQKVFGFLPYSPRNRQGSLGEYVVVPTTEIAAMPPGLGADEAAAMATVGCTALQALRDDARLSAGASVFVNGASGGVGSAAVQIAKLLGAGEVWGACSASKRAGVEALGIDRVIDYRATPLAEVGRQFDVFFDVAATSSLAACAPILRRGGTYVTLLPGLGLLWGKLTGWMSQRRATFTAVRARTADLALLAQWHGAGQLRVAIEKPFPFAQAADALAALDAGTHAGKLVVHGGAIGL